MINDEIQSKEHLMLIAYQQRISEIVSMYEAQIISLRADITVLLNEKTESKTVFSNSEE